MKGLNDLVRQAQVMQKKMSKLQDELAQRTIEASAGGGMVTVTVNGSQELTDLKIDPTVINPDDVEMLKDLIMAAVNDGLKKSKDMVQDEMSQLTGGIKIPGLM